MVDIPVNIKGKDNASADIKRVDRNLDRLEDQTKKTQRRFDQLDREVKQTSRSMRKLGTASNVTGAAIGGLSAKFSGLAGAAGVGLFAKFATDALQSADNIGKLNKSFGIGVETLQRWQHTARLSGVELDDLIKGSRTLSGTILDANDGLVTYQRAFDRLGVSYQALQGLSPEQQMNVVADALTRVGDKSERTALAADLLGRAGPKLNAAFGEVSGTFADLNTKLDENAILTAEQVRQAEEFNDKITTLSANIKGAFTTALLETIDNLTTIGGALSDLADLAPIDIDINLNVGSSGPGFTIPGTDIKFNPLNPAGLVLDAGAELIRTVNPDRVAPGQGGTARAPGTAASTPFTSPNNLPVNFNTPEQRTLLGRYEDAYDPGTTSQRPSEQTTQNSVDKFIQDLNVGINNALTSGYTFDPGAGSSTGSSTGSGTGSGAARDLGPQSAAAFDRLDVSTAQRDFNTSLEGGDFDLARESLATLRDIRIGQAKGLDTAGETALATFGAITAFEDGTARVEAAEEKAAQDIINAGEQSDRAFVQLDAKGAQRAFQLALQGEDFDGALESLAELHGIRVGQAELLDTAGEQALAAFDANTAFVDGVVSIEDAQQAAADKIVAANAAAAAEVVAELVRQDQADDLITSAEGRLIADSQLGEEYQDDLTELALTADSLRAGAGAFDDPAAQLEAIDAFVATETRRINDAYLGLGLTDAPIASTSARTPGISAPDNSVGDIYITITEAIDDRGNRVRFIESATQDGINEGRIIFRDA